MSGRWSAELKREDLLVAVLLILGTLVLYWTAPKGGAFYWSEAPRHALNGVFVKDLLAAMPLRDPVGYAYGYYAQYPALTILFYPPLFYVTSAPFYALFGVSHETALLALMAHYVAFGWGCYRLARFWQGPGVAGAMALTMMFVPEIAFWGRQVMLEVPAFAFVVWSAVFFVRHLRGGRTRDLAVAAALLVLGMYTKITVVFMAAAFAAALVYERRTAVLKYRPAWLILGLSIVALLPLVALTAKFGQVNVQSITGLPDRVVPRSSLEGWTWYARQWPDQLGWPLLAAAIAGAIGIALRRRDFAVVPKAERAFLVSWLLAGYLFFSAIDLKEARHSVYILLPLVAASFTTIEIAMERVGALAVAAVLAVMTICWTLLLRPVYYVDGYAEAAARVAELAPKNSVVLFSGYRDGAFTFSLRAREDRRDLSVLRADKLLVRVAVKRQLGVEQKVLQEGEIAALLNRYAVHYLVVQPGFWRDLEVMQRFEAMLKRGHFVEVARIKTPANYSSSESELVVYRNTGPVATGPVEVKLDIPLAGKSISATLGGQ